MDIHLLSVPYDTARRGERMGAGPDRLLESGAAVRLREHGHRVRVAEIAPPAGTFPAEIRTAFELQREVAAAVRGAVAEGALPVVLAGNCNAAALGTLAGLRERPVGVLWFDSHGDFNTPETTGSGFLDGMALAMATGRCWTQLLARLPGFEPVAPANVVLIGARDLDPIEASLLAESPVALIRPADVDTGLAPALDALRGRVRDVYVHIDLDVLDPASHGRANGLAAPDGLGVGQVASALHAIAHHFRVRGAALTAYDPAVDADGRVCRAALALLEAVADASASAAGG
ncbi:MAG: arginase family protein [Gemmatimonadota bacterium]|nr:arginase family protein [Gemmatimonadota bacterium]